GRDVTEREYAVSVEGGAWHLNGSDLDEAASNAETVRATSNLADRSAEIVRYVAKHPEGVKSADVAEALDMDPNDANRYLTRLLKAEKVSRPRRGLYTPVLSVL